VVRARGLLLADFSCLFFDLFHLLGLIVAET
jgi:hypothetical protein